MLFSFDCWGMFENRRGTHGQQKMNKPLYTTVERSSECTGYMEWYLLKIWQKISSRRDAFLICYDVDKDQSKGTNYHKTLEFISRQDHYFK